MAVYTLKLRSPFPVTFRLQIGSLHQCNSFFLTSEQDALIIVSFTPKDDPALTTPRGKRTRGSAKEEPHSKSQKGWFYEPLNSDSEDGMGTRGEDRVSNTENDGKVGIPGRTG